MTQITFSRLTSPLSPHYAAAQDLYHSAFPACERRDEATHRDKLHDAAFFAYTIYNKEEFAGILYFWRWDNYSFVEHFATVSSLRGGGIGGLAIERWKSLQAGRTLLLEVEPPEGRIERRRIGFYERHGFCLNSHYHLHPSYSPSTESHELLVMSYPTTIDAQEFAEFRRYTLDHILRSPTVPQ